MHAVLHYITLWYAIPVGVRMPSLAGRAAISQLVFFKLIPSEQPEHAFSDPDVQANAAGVKQTAEDSKAWWQHYGYECPQLQDAALKLMSAPPTAAGDERDWSTWSFVWSNSRDRLLLGHVALLVYVYFRNMSQQSGPHENHSQLHRRRLAQLPRGAGRKAGGRPGRRVGAGPGW
jgi:hypothetical protein